ncbi:hypothetical protein AVEN_237606-1 [Araneus ventricosus]|uniref:Uncharacterized protein n=1 Tax=Araneus ventricosus TaxID=182803 RepID=A0A4Y2L075_ARAVE|nr:hypothetical protein AVEN_237606-1 [Araneus ventricosus]
MRVYTFEPFEEVIFTTIQQRSIGKKLRDTNHHNMPNVNYLSPCVRQNTYCIWFVVNRFRTVRISLASNEKLHSHMRTSCSQVVCEPFGSQIYTRFQAFLKDGALSPNSCSCFSFRWSHQKTLQPPG